jgi:hypothetical protein
MPNRVRADSRRSRGAPGWHLLRIQVRVRAETFDTTLILLALHHYTAAETLLDEAVRLTQQRLIVMESE